MQSKTNIYKQTKREKEKKNDVKWKAARRQTLDEKKRTTNDNKHQKHNEIILGDDIESSAHWAYRWVLNTVPPVLSFVRKKAVCLVCVMESAYSLLLLLFAKKMRERAEEWALFFIRQKTLFSFRPTQLLKLSRSQRIVKSKLNVNGIIIIIVFAVRVVHSFVFLRFQPRYCQSNDLIQQNRISFKSTKYTYHPWQSYSHIFFVVCLSLHKWNAFRILLNCFVIERTKIQHFLHTTNKNDWNHTAWA